MKAILVLFFCGLTGGLLAQYDFPVVINGLSASLNLDGNKTLAAADWLVNNVNDCSPDSLLVSRTIFPRNDSPPPSAMDSITFICNDFSSESVEIWWKGLAGEWLVMDSYVLLNGFANCDCDTLCGQNASPILLNGYSLSYDSDSMVTVAAREFVAIDEAGQSYSYGPDPADSIRTFSCSDGQVTALDIFAHSAGLDSRSANTYIAINTVNCAGGTSFNGESARVIQGLSVPTGPGGIITVPARAFAAPFGGEQQLAFSENPMDTLLTIDCSNIGSGATQVLLYNHFGGSVGPPAESYVIGEDGRLFCIGIAGPRALNDDRTDATPLSNCEHFGQFINASREFEEPQIDSSGGNGNTVWYSFPLERDGQRQNLQIRPVDSIYFAIYAPIDGFGPTDPIASGLLLSDTIINLCWTGSDFENWDLQIQQVNASDPARFYLQTGSENDCPVTTVEAVLTNKLSIFPNPGTGLFQVSGLQAINQSFTIEVYAANGQLVYSIKNEHQIDISQASPGMYYAKIVLADGSGSVLRLVKQ